MVTLRVAPGHDEIRPPDRKRCCIALCFARWAVAKDTMAESRSSMSTETIFALSSGHPPAAIAVVRVSGPAAGGAVAKLAGRVPRPRQAALMRLRDGAGGMLDDALVLWFPAPASETGEDVAEFQLHGGRAVIAAVLRELETVPGCRTAEPGEFSRRAFLNGKIDLTQAEGLADLIAAETDVQRQNAYRHRDGVFGRRVEDWRRGLVEARALTEAPIDFSDEDDVPDDLPGRVAEIVQMLRSKIAEALEAGRRGERLREGLVVAIAGPPNAGKSTLINRIAGREVAIVSPHAGTTRDVIEVRLDLDGYPVILLDTAGIRDSSDPVEQEGVRRARDRAAEADVILWLTDGSPDAGYKTELYQYDSKISDKAPAATAKIINIINKIDKMSRNNESVVNNEHEIIKESKFIISPDSRSHGPVSRETPLPISAETGAGVDRLLDIIRDIAREYFSGAESALVTRSRHRTVLTAALQALDRAMALSPLTQAELVAEELRAASDALGRLTGRIDVEDVLDVIFGEFCIGK